MRTRSSSNRINATSKLVIKERDIFKFPKVRLLKKTRQVKPTPKCIERVTPKPPKRTPQPIEIVLFKTQKEEPSKFQEEKKNQIKSKIPMLNIELKQNTQKRVEFRDYHTLKELFAKKFQLSFDSTKRHVVSGLHSQK